MHYILSKSAIQLHSKYRSTVKLLIGASLSKPHTSVDLACIPTGNNVCMYVCIIYVCGHTINPFNARVIAWEDV